MTKPTAKKNGAQINHRNQRSDARHGEERPGAKGAQHDELAMGDVQDPGHAVLQAEADGNEGVDAAREQAADRYVEEPHDHDKSLLNLVSRTTRISAHRSAHHLATGDGLAARPAQKPPLSARWPPEDPSRRPTSFESELRYFLAGGGSHAGFGYIGFAVLFAPTSMTSHFPFCH